MKQVCVTTWNICSKCFNSNGLLYILVMKAPSEHYRLEEDIPLVLLQLHHCMDTVEAHAQPYKEDCLRCHATHHRCSTTVFIPLTEVAMAKDTKLIPGTDSGHARNRVTELWEDLDQQKKWPLPITVTIHELSYQTLWVIKVIH